MGKYCIKGDNVFKGYYGKPEATEEVMTEDGYFMSGDMGKLMRMAELRTGRKDIIVTANGKNIAPR